MLKDYRIKVSIISHFPVWSKSPQYKPPTYTLYSTLKKFIIKAHDFV